MVAQGIDATTVAIEVSEFKGINFHLVGLPENAVKESQQRSFSSIKTNNLEIHRKKIATNFA